MLLGHFNFFYKDSLHPVNWNFLMVMLIILFSTINRLIHWNEIGDLNTLFPYFILMIPTYIIVVGFNKMDAKILVAFICMEAIVVILEWMLGISSFDSSLAGFRSFQEGDLAYNQRPLGISESSSHIAAKLFIGWVLIDFYGFKSKVWWLVKALFVAAIVFTFNRSVFLSLAIYLVISQLTEFLKMNYKLENAILGFISFVFGGVALAIGGFIYGQKIIDQVTRNTGTVELTGREYLWQDFGDFIYENLVFGNNSVKLWLDGYHAHNSYIEVIATNGIFIAMLYFVLVFRNINKNNWVYVLPILIYGITQYAFFWGISLMDILFWLILFTSPIKEKNSSLILQPIEQVPSRKQSLSQ